MNVGVGGSATFTVTASGEGLTYQWFGPGGVALSDTSGEIAGATTVTLQLFNIQSNDAGSYQAQVSNAGGSVNSVIITLTISTLKQYRECPTRLMTPNVLFVNSNMLIFRMSQLECCYCQVYIHTKR